MKSAPISIRYIEERLELVMQDENLKTVQQVIDFLLEQYWWNKKGRTYPAQISHEEAKKEEYKQSGFKQEIPQRDNEDILQEIKTLKALKCPSYIGGKAWEAQQEKKISELQKQLK